MPKIEITRTCPNLIVAPMETLSGPLGVKGAPPGTSFEYK